MGTGKSAVGLALAKQLNRPFVDVDTLIEKQVGQSIAEIFLQKGEAHFRQVEAEITRGVASGQGQVVATGGGAVLDEKNLSALKSNGWLVWLKAKPDVIQQRVGDVESRPLLQDGTDAKDRIVELLALREVHYAKADVAIETSDRSINSIVDDILKQLPKQEKA